MPKVSSTRPASKMKKGKTAKEKQSADEEKAKEKTQTKALKIDEEESEWDRRDNESNTSSLSEAGSEHEVSADLKSGENPDSDYGKEADDLEGALNGILNSEAEKDSDNREVSPNGHIESDSNQELDEGEASPVHKPESPSATERGSREKSPEYDFEADMRRQMEGGESPSNSEAGKPTESPNPISDREGSPDDDLEARMQAELNGGDSLPNNEPGISHMPPQTGQKRFQCPFPDCDKRYSRKDGLNRHLRKDHLVDPNAPMIEDAAFPTSSLETMDVEIPPTVDLVPKVPPEESSMRPVAQTSSKSRRKRTGGELASPPKRARRNTSPNPIPSPSKGRKKSHKKSKKRRNTSPEVIPIPVEDEDEPIVKAPITIEEIMEDIPPIITGELCEDCRQEIKKRIENELEKLDVDHRGDPIKPSVMIRARLLQKEGQIDLSVPGLRIPDTEGYDVIFGKYKRVRSLGSSLIKGFDDFTVEVITREKKSEPEHIVYLAKIYQQNKIQLTKVFGTYENAMKVAQNVLDTLNGHRDIQEEETRQIAISLFSGEENLAVPWIGDAEQRFKVGKLTDAEMNTAIQEKKREEEEARRIKKEKRDEETRLKRARRASRMAGEGSAEIPFEFKANKEVEQEEEDDTGEQQQTDTQRKSSHDPKVWMKNEKYSWQTNPDDWRPPEKKLIPLPEKKKELAGTFEDPIEFLD
jgi:hypothetical protein